MIRDNKLLSYQSLNTDIAALLLRIIFGGLFVRYGYNKIIGYDQASNVSGSNWYRFKALL